jgi:antitoxin FitA
MSSTLTIRNLDETVKQKLRLRGARHKRSMEAEARQILTRAVNEPDPLPPPRTPEEMLGRLASVRGAWKDRGTTDDLMALTRGKD